MDQGGHGAPKILNFWQKKKEGNLVHPYDQWPSLKLKKIKKKNHFYITSP